MSYICTISFTSSSFPLQPRHHQPFSHYTRSKHLTQHDFYDVLCDRLTAVNKDRANMKQRAQNLARMNGKSYEEIMVSRKAAGASYLHHN